MRGFRAKDSDRERYVDLIEAAYVDGQIGDADRELRVGRALLAESVDELEALTRDLQRPAGFVPTTPVAAVRAPVGQRIGTVVIIAIAAVVVAGGVAMVALVGLASGPSVDSSGTAGGPVVSEEVVVAEPPAAREFELSASRVRAFVKAYESEFGTLRAYEVGFFPDRIQAQVPVRGPRPRMERWSWDGEWRQDTEASAVVGPNQVVDLGPVDVRRFFANIATARTTLDVERGRFTHALLIRWGDEATELNIYVGNRFNESGYLSSTPAGEITRRVPYAP